eukprot:9294784-Pyramimonas_sp.AAC.1
MSSSSSLDASGDALLGLGRRPFAGGREMGPDKEGEKRREMYREREKERAITGIRMGPALLSETQCLPALHLELAKR